jgi:hypothetical protein
MSLWWFDCSNTANLSNMVSGIDGAELQTAVPPTLGSFHLISRVIFGYTRPNWYVFVSLSGIGKLAN